MNEETADQPGFEGLGLSDVVLKTLNAIGYETPSPIQAAIIPHVAEGKDVIGQAQTGTGKTAAFALPLLSTIDLKRTKKPQALVLAPTRELAIQVAEAFQGYAAGLKGFHVLPIYGGQDFRPQFRQLQRGVHVIVGTPGRVMDHMRRETLKLDELTTIVLDEADEMLRMGFIDDVEWILERTPADRQVALFSATMPPPIKRIAQKYLNEPVEISIKSKTRTADTVRQRFWMVSGLHKLDALTRILEGETFDGMIIFVRTKTATTMLAERLQARGFAASPLNGDIPQIKRERTIDRLKAGKLDILVATDVAARGLDVDRVSHVINYDIPYDTESYVHRIGRTGRAGRTGDAILFVSPRETRMLKTIERATNQRIDRMDMPSISTINDKRLSTFKDRITSAMAEEGLEEYRELIEEYRQERDIPSLEIAAALAKLLQGEEPLLLNEKKLSKKEKPFEQKEERRSRDRDRDARSTDEPRRNDRRSDGRSPAEGMERFRIEVGREHGVKPGNIVGAIANEAGLDAKHIGHIELFDNFSTVDLPKDMPKEVLRLLKKVWVSGQQLRITRTEDPSQRNRDRKDRQFKRFMKK